jgi:transcriptional regulator GlxA family with amidase domain
VQPIAVRTNDRIASVADWMAGNLASQITIEALADRAAMSVRTFTRRFRAATGAAPIEWLIRLRVRRAQDLLETSDASIDHIADASGFGAPETLRHHFRKVVGTSPSAWRSSFRGKAA